MKGVIMLATLGAFIGWDAGSDAGSGLARPHSVDPENWLPGQLSLSRVGRRNSRHKRSARSRQLTK